VALPISETLATAAIAVVSKRAEEPPDLRPVELKLNLLKARSANLLAQCKDYLS